MNSRNMKSLLQILFVFGLCTSLTAQRAEQSAGRAYGEVLVQLAPNVGVEVVSEICRRRENINLYWERALATDWRMHLYRFDENTVALERVLAILRKEPVVMAVQGNYATYERVQPNDAEWYRQKNLTLVKAPEAWDITTGGTTAQGDTIVAAILEKGYYRDHPDYQANRWYNHLEIPDNGIDDDGNGYTDDFRGYDPRFNSDGFGNQSNHGTGVTGIVGAQGNNAIGISGVNWSVKLMNISNVDKEDEIIEAYYYVHTMRKLYNQTNGAKGAYVVTTNASFGLDKEFAADHPLWCAVYDSLGQQGIVSVGATINENINVDIEGDMPTTCPSPYLITVTNVNLLDIKQNAGYGPASIDMAAPGTGVVTTGYAGGQAVYSVLGGTSSAAPHVTGTIALLHSVKCEKLTADALSKPRLVAERFRDLVLNNLDTNPTLKSITKYEGRLNIFKAVTAARETYCDQTYGDLALTKAYISASDQFTYDGIVPDNGDYLFQVHSVFGQLIYETTISRSTGYFYNSIEATNWAAGLYIATVRSGKKVSSKKFLKF